MTAYLYIGHPDWSVHYLTDASKLPIYALAGVIGAEAVSLLLTWYIGALFMQKEKRFLTGILLALTSAGMIAGTVMLVGRLSVYGSYRAYTENLTVGLMQVKLGYVLVAWLVGTAAAAAFVCLELHRDSRRARAV